MQRHHIAGRAALLLLIATLAAACADAGVIQPPDEPLPPPPPPPASVASVRLTSASPIVLAWNGSTQVAAAALDSSGNELPGRTVQWTSAAPAVAQVNAGAITAIGAGTTIVIATIEQVAASVSVQVNRAPIVSLSIEGATDLEVGDQAAFVVRATRANGDQSFMTVALTSSAPAIVTVDHRDNQIAMVIAESSGTAMLTAAMDGVSASVQVRVAPRAAHDLIYNRWSGAASELFVLGLSGNGTVPARINAGNVSREPSPSPDGLQVVFAVSQPAINGETQNDLYIVNRNGTNMRWLTRVAGLEDQPQWSPDGSTILFHGIVDGRADLFTIAVDGTGLTNLTAAIAASMTDKREPAWSRDGGTIAFIGVVEGRHKVWTIGANGGGVRQVTTDAGFDAHPSFSPDGMRIAFSSYNAASPSLGDDIMIVPASGGTPERLALPGDQRTPAWSPDGHYIALSGTAIAGRGQIEIYTLRPDGTGLKLRTVNPAWGGGVNPSWITR